MCSSLDMKRTTGGLLLGPGELSLRKKYGTVTAWPTRLAETHGPSDQDEVVGYRQCDSLSPVRRCASLIIIILFVNVWRTNGYTCLDTHAAIETREPHPVAEGMGQDACVDIAGARKDESSEKAKQRGVGELEERASECHDEWDAWVGDAELVQVVDMGDAEIEWGQEDDLLAGEAG